MSVRVRFAPSPTGYLHVGGARTAIFNWLYARHHGGVFVLRIEDTDEQRSSEELVRAILDGMAWLGMAPDEGPFFQTAHRAQHVADARRLLDENKAYRCFCDAATLKAEREAAEKAGGGYIYPRRCLGIPRAESDRRAGAGEPFVVRLEVPPGATAWDDGVHGATSFPNEVIEDLILLRSDGTPTYNLSVVSDDVAMRITHVIRGDDHISNTPKQILIYRGLGNEPPTFAHLPLILGTDKKRLSKRHGATSVLEYRDEGILPDAMFNFLALLGWNPGDERVKMTRDELRAAFDLGGVGKSGAVFDRAKLEWLNGLYVAEMSGAAFEAEARRRLVDAGFAPGDDSRLRGILSLLQPRVKTLAAIAEDARFFFVADDALDYDADGVRKHMKDPAAVGALADEWKALPDWSAAALESSLRALAEQRGLKAGQLIHPVRLAVTGRTASPGLFEVVELLGRERALGRMRRLLDLVSAGLV
ncbi:MAG TPA: glutamate--tRNA ligase [Candidatus Polarisedimenticolaceae bacterium]|nr:glutamate--tRNA ligase [Candidatus Polarisedimenticolaceae bacterium]